MSYYRNRLIARITNTQPTKTDQAASNETDMNVIVGRMLSSGTLPGSARQPVYGDFTQFPTDLREMIDLGRSMQKHLGQLPDVLRKLPIEQLITLTNDELNALLKPSEPTETKADTPKDKT